MNRRTALRTLVNRKTKTQESAPLEQSLNTYTGAWDMAQAAHLLRRTMFGPTYAQMKDAVTNGMDATVTQLLADLPMPPHPVYYESGNPYGAVGDTWYNALDTNGQNNPYWRRSLYGWTIEQLTYEGVSIREKMTLFWQNHFAISTAVVGDQRLMYQYISLLRENALGDFKQLVKDITINPAMLYFLNGRSNTKNAPNENYARELMELYTLGKGDLAGEGDYTTFTEIDVAAIARALTGWKVAFDDSTGVITGGPYFNESKHDTDPKVLSHRFNNITILDSGEQEYIDVVDILFTYKEQIIAEFICRKLFRWFVNYTVDTTIEQNVIVPMANILIANNFQIKPVLEALLKSECFYDACSVGSMVKSPLDFTVSIFKQFGIVIPTDIYSKYSVFKSTYNVYLEVQQMPYYNPPTVAGWKAYYQEPQYYRFWINSVTLRARALFSGRMVNGRAVGGVFLKIDVLTFLETLDNPADPNSVIDECATILFAQDISQTQKDLLKAILLSNQSEDAYWIDLYYNYQSNPTAYETAIDSRFRTMLEGMISMAEFQLM